MTKSDKAHVFEFSPDTFHVSTLQLNSKWEGEHQLKKNIKYIL